MAAGSNNRNTSTKTGSRGVVRKTIDDAIIAGILATIISSVVLVGLVMYLPNLLARFNPITRLFLPVTAALFLSVKIGRLFR